MFYQTPLFSFRSVPTLSKKKGEIAVLVSKKSYKRAVDRNKLKRRGRAITKILLKKTSLSYFYILSFKKGALEATFKELEAEIQKIFTKLK